MAAKTTPAKKTVSGFCNSFGKKPQHEGTKPVSTSGAPMPTCQDWVNCACICHKQITEMYEMIGEPRPEPEPSAEYLEWVRSQRGQFNMPSRYDTDDPSVLLHADGPDVPPDHEGTPTAPGNAALAPSRGTPSPVTPARGTVAPTFKPTPTGRRQAGQLEHDVLTVCIEFANDVYEWEECLTKLVAERIGVMYQAEPPSTGAIDAVWDRWEKMKFAMRGRKPSRFLLFMKPDAPDQRLVLQQMKDQVVRDRKRASAELRRGSLRPRSR